MDKLLLNKTTKQHAKRLIDSNAGVVLITGRTGSGKSKLALAMAEKMLNGQNDSLISKGRLMLIDGAEAGIEDVRGLIKRISIKSGHEQLFLINNIDELGHEAQNALLKTLEQLPPSSRFIMTATHPGAVLATIRSRATSFSVRPVTLTEAQKFFDGQADIDKYWSMSGGLAGELAELLKKDSPLDSAINDAKQFLSLSTYERLIFIDKYQSSRENLNLFLDALQRILKAATQTAADKQQPSLKRLVESRRTIAELITALSANASTKLVALKLATSLPV